MKIFISWSGSRSLAVAEVMSDWIKCVLQASQPWISTRHIERGSLWFSEINEKLRDVSVGIVCLTQENKNKPWILFETGALAKGLSGNRVCTFLVDLQTSDLVDPLAQFNHTMPNQSSVRELVKTLNICLGDDALEDRVLEKIFEVYWPSFEEAFAKALEKNPQNEVIAPRTETDILSEILENTRSLGKRVGMLESARPGQRVTNSVEEQVKPGNLFSGMNARKQIDRWVANGVSVAEIHLAIREMRLTPASAKNAYDYANRVATKANFPDDSDSSDSLI
ncbi:toll/interleukin-1 receptor domain-containing protein [Pseudomonas syringae]|uniref:toll/interleukin-1 receptor domain-containing protein n=1 Tax=Pseudomonas syringae TaxID=317 RepID=UPI000EFE97BD|nr:toll/interleukin-1 receptor domain-containing protein [Pseudomonas syringae]